MSGTGKKCDLVDDALTPERPLEAYLWRSFVQLGAKVQPVFRSNRNYHARSPYVGETTFSEGSVRGAQSQVMMALVGRSAFSWMMRPEPTATMRLGRGL
jgi:hypothetical protein